MKYEKIICGIVSAILFISIASAGLGVVSEYAEEGNALELYPGQSINTYFKVQNSDMANDISVEAEITKGAEISSLVDGNRYDIKGGEQKVAYLRVSVPKNAPVGTEYPVGVLFKQTQQAAGGGMIGFVFNVDREFKVRVVEKPAEANAGNNMSVWIWALVILAIALVVWYVLKKKKNSQVVVSAKKR